MWKATVTLLSFILAACNVNEDMQHPKTPGYEDGLGDGVNYGIAAQYPGDEGIENDPAVLAVENFEKGEVTIYTEYNRYRDNVDVVDDEHFSGNYGGKHQWPEGLNGPTCRYPIPEKAHQGENPSYFVRMYFKYDSSFHPGDGMEPVGVKGFGIYNEKQTGEPCDGTNWYCVSCQFVGWGPSQKPDANDGYLWFGHMYSYNPAPEEVYADVGKIKITNPAKGDKPYRFSIYSDPYKYIRFGEWYCYELGLYLNTPGKNDGEARFWINGVLQSRSTNMRFRDLEDLKPEYIQLNLHRTTENFPQTMVRYVDDIVIATRYIGPVKKK